jgi:hypothetical protein
MTGYELRKLEWASKNANYNPQVKAKFAYLAICERRKGEHVPTLWGYLPVWHMYECENGELSRWNPCEHASAAYKYGRKS